MNDVDRVAPATGPQRGLWLLNRLDPGSAAYNTLWVFDIAGPVLLAELEAALGTVVGRHEALRTTFALDKGVLLQYVHSRSSVPFEVTDLRSIAAPEREEHLDRLIAAHGAVPFDLAAGPLMRVAAVRRSEAETTVAIAVHHIVWDGWSAAVFEREWTTAYRALAEGRRHEFPPLTIQYADHAAEEADKDFGDHLAYWRDRLAGAPSLLELPGSRRTSDPARPGRTDTFALAPGTASRVHELAKAEGVTPFIVLLAAFAVLMSRYTGADDMIIGTPVNTRSRPELDELIGYFVNLMPVRISISPEATFRSLLEGVQCSVIDGFAYPDLPFERIVDQLGLDRSTQHPPLVQVLFGLHSEESEPLDFGTARAERRVHSTDAAKFDLIWSVFDGGELRGEAEYRSDLFDPSLIARLAADWRRLLDQALDAPARTLRELAAPVTGPSGPRRVPPGQCLHRLFERAAAIHGSETAVSCEGRKLSYAELEARANQLAHALIDAGVARGDRVGLLLDRSVDLVVAILAVLKTGAAYVPVDLAAPADRAAMVFADIAARIVVTDRPGRVPDGPWQCYELEQRTAEIAAMPMSRPEVAGRPADTAYILFTSGSTGRPKGVAVAHEHVSRLMEAGAQHFGYGAREVSTLFHSYAFDLTVWEMWGALLHGGQVVVVPYLVSRSPDEFAELLEAEAVSYLCMTPSALRQLEASLSRRPRALPALKWITLGGEALDPAVVERWFALDPAPGAQLCNLYGITETTVHVTTFHVDSPERFRRSLIGGPMQHLDLKVLDDWLHPCPVGVPGELYVSGGSLAHGYWGRPDLTAGRFVADPCSSVPGTRMYRSGDVVRRLPDGGLEYIGRADFQVKLRGYRAEIGEIESALSAHRDVSACVVVLRDERLAAYVTGRVPADVREFLGRSLPDYMIPASFTLLDSLPLTVNGKVDRAALPAASAGAAAPRATSVAPHTPMEHTFASAWSQVLEVPDIGVHDDFFALGGDSIRAVQLAGALDEQGWQVSLRDIFASPTIAGLVPLARPAADSAPAAGPFALVGPADRAQLPAGLADAYPMVSMQLGMIYHMEFAGRTENYHNVNSFRIGCELNEAALEQAVRELLQRHPVLRTSFDVSSFSEPLQLVHETVPIPVRFGDLRGSCAQDAGVRAVFEEHRRTPFDLTRPPLIRISAHRLEAEAFQLTLSEHHAILDGWSFTSLLTELLERHAELSAAPASAQLPPLKSSFRDFVVIEREAARAEASLRYWRDKLDGASGVLWDDDGVQEVPHTIERLLERAPGQLRAVADATGTSVKSVSVAAHLRALRLITSREVITSGVGMNGRLERPDGIKVYGLFLNTVPLVCARPDDDPLSLVRRVHREEWEMMPHRRVPFAELAAMMADSRLDSYFGYLRFHALSRLGPETIADGRVGCEPTMRHEPTNFTLGAALIQDPKSQRVLLAVDHRRSVIPDAKAIAYVDGYENELEGMAAAANC